MRAAGFLILLAASLLVPSPIGALGLQVSVIVHPSRTDKLTRNVTRAIYLRQKLFWDDGEPVVPINREAGSRVRELFSEKIFGQDSRQLAGYWNQRYFEAGEFPPATLASDQAVIHFVAANANAIGYVAANDMGQSVVVALVLP